MNENERTGGDSGGEPPRRRRGRRSAPAQRSGQRNGQRGGQRSGQKNGQRNGQRPSDGAPSRGRGGQSRRRNQNNQKNQNSQASHNNHNSQGKGNQNKGNQGTKKSNSRNNNRSRPARTSARTNSDPLYDVHSELPVSVETSAGGLILSGLAEAVRKDGSVDLSSIYVALIGRLDRRGRLLWSMPKGHIEPDESTVATAEREVWEETGVAGSVIAELGTIDYWFVSEGVRIHKTVHHYLLRFEDGDLNDEDPEVTEVQWLPVHQLVERLAYADERRLARDAFDLLPELAHAEVQAGRVTPR